MERVKKKINQHHNQKLLKQHISHGEKCEAWKTDASKNCSIFQNTHKCWIKMMRTTPVSIWKLYSMACWDDDEHQQQKKIKQ